MKFKVLFETINRDKIKNLFMKFSKKYFNQYHGKFPFPEIKFKILQKEHGKYVFTLEDPPNQSLIINKEILSNEEILNSILIHEIIHYYDNWINKNFFFWNE